MVAYPIQPERTALLVIDMQNDFLLPSSPVAAEQGSIAIAQVNRIIAACRQTAIPVFFVAATHTPEDFDRWRQNQLFPALPMRQEGTPGWQIHSDVDFRPGDVLVRKPRYSAFWRTDLDERLGGLEVDTLIIGGVCTNVCVESTARDASFRDYKVIVLGDACRTYGIPDLGWGAVSMEEIQRVTLADLAMHVGEVATVEAVVQRIRAAVEPVRT